MLQKCSCPSLCAVCDLGDAECAGFVCVSSQGCCLSRTFLVQLPSLGPVTCRHKATQIWAGFCII